MFNDRNTNDFYIFFGVIGFIIIMIIFITLLVVLNKKHIKQKFNDNTQNDIEDIVNNVIKKSNYNNIKNPSNMHEMNMYKNNILKYYPLWYKESSLECLNKFKNIPIPYLLVTVNNSIKKHIGNNDIKPNFSNSSNHYMLITNVKNFAINKHIIDIKSLNNTNKITSYIELFKQVLSYCDINFNAAKLYNYNNFDDFKLSLYNMLHITFLETFKSTFNLNKDKNELQDRITYQNKLLHNS